VSSTVPQDDVFIEKELGDGISGWFILGSSEVNGPRCRKGRDDASKEGVKKTAKKGGVP